VQQSKLARSSGNFFTSNVLYKIFILVLINFPAINHGLSCTIFYTAQNGVILAGNNEDWKDPYTHMWFYPANDSTHGWVKFGFGSGFPQGGVNDQGLFWDGTAGPYLDMPYSEANKILYDGPLMQKVMEKSASITEALEIFNQYYCEDQYRAQYLLGDSVGYSMIVEGDNVIPTTIGNENNFQVLTNFYQSHPDLGGYPCWRYETAVELLENCDSLTTWFAGTVLASTHQEGTYPTQYSNIYDLKAGIIYLFYYHNYEEFLVINLKDELEKGYNTYAIPQIFSKINIGSPLIAAASVTLKWRGLPGSQYEIILSKNPDYTDTLNTGIKSIETQYTQSTKAAILFPAALVILLFLLIKRNKAWYLFPAFACLCFLVNCAKEDTTTEETDNTIEFSKIVDGLEPDTTYYWKIRSSTGYTDNFFTETATQSFKTLSD